MIPVTLQLSNFLSYGKEVPTLDFTEFNIACLSGGNGQGKSALLDALTWALWGEGRKAQQEKKADKGLLKIGENQMWVDLVFDLESERYRIIRKFSVVKSRSLSQLEFMVFDSSKNDYITLSTPSQRQTQQKINGLLRMDYDTFINSAFILQGRVDEFTRKSARERKQILAEVLGLSHYEELSELARRHSRELEKDFLVHQNRLEQIRKEIGQKEGVLEEIKTIREEERKLQSLIQEKKEIVQKLEQGTNRLQYSQQQAEELTARLSIEQNESQELKKRKERIKQKIQEYRLLLAEERKILSDYNIYLNLSKQNKQMLQQLALFRKLEQQKIEVEKLIESNKNRLLLQLAQKQEKYDELTKQIESLTSVKKEIKKLEIQLNHFRALEQKKELIEQDGNSLKVQIESKNHQIKIEKEDIIDNKEKITLLKQGSQESCPLCDSPLDEQKKEHIITTLTSDIDQSEQKIIKLTTEIAELTDKKDILQKEWFNIRTELNKKDEVQNKLNTYSLLIQEENKILEQLKELAPALKDLQTTIKEQQFAFEERKRWSKIKSEIEKLAYSDQKYLEINRQLEALSDAMLQREKLLEARQSFLKLEEERKEIDQQYEMKESSIHKLREDLASIQKNVAKISDLKQKTLKERKILEQWQMEQGQLYIRRGAVQERLTKIEQYQQEEEQIKKAQNVLSHQKDIYEKLIIAFGKNGIPSMVIENAIPELAEEANAILAKLSDEPITISLESLKELKSGEVRETLDIKILDEMGIRPYELYSGGEAFRIDFSLRLALSKLLTQRSGARLRTLVIDEGFGTQDEEGLQKLIQAINAIQNDFDKILVITHLSILKDAFPVRIEVWKDPASGSQFQMVHL
ncbi:MAG TPA: SMC family ATPase [Atribacterota bacterium]|nr:SMC family ATPase [Atribacterota bacterium]